MRIGLVLVLVAACSRNNSSYTGSDDLSGTSDDLAVADDLSVSGDAAMTGDGGGADGGDGGVIACMSDQVCFTGSDPAKRNVGACRDGIRQCINGFLGPCSGEVLPSAESCNGI